MGLYSQKEVITMKKKTLCIALTLFLALSAAACSGAKDTTDTKTPAVSVTSTDTHTNSEAGTTATESSGELKPRITGEKSVSAGEKYGRDGAVADDYLMTEEAVTGSARMAEGARSSAAKSADKAGAAYEGTPEVNTAPTTPTATDTPVPAVAPTAPTTTEPAAPADKPVASPSDKTVDMPDDAPAAEAPTEDYIDALPPETSYIDDTAIEIREPVIPEVIDLPEIQPQAGLLTAGEWNDNKNWGFFENLVRAKTIEFPSYGIDPRYRYRVEVRATDGSAVVNAKVTLYNADNQPLWTAMTDKEGMVYLFAPSEYEGTWCKVESNGETKEATFVYQEPQRLAVSGEELPQTQSRPIMASIIVTMDGKGSTYQKTDIMFILDATGSMSDEMLFLQKEFTAISQDVGDENTRYSVNFYRDHGDDYVTKCYDFTKDIQGLQQKLNEEYATGGGDTPEAVAEILEETIGKTNWDEDSVKLAFLIFDAPPHEGKESSLQQSIQSAAEKGIHIIPVVSSGSERDTELFGRAAAIMTNGTYIFLTDDSGIGGSHMEPIIGDYQVEKLYDIVVRVINSYKQ